MKLVFNCSGCKKENVFKPKFSDRGLLQEQMGDEVKVNCKRCGKMENKHINRIDAVPDRRVIAVSIVAGIVLTLFLLFFIGLLASVTLTLPIMAWLYESNASNTFNRYKIRRK